MNRSETPEIRPLTNGFQSTASTVGRLEEEEPQIPVPEPVEDDGREGPKGTTTGPPTQDPNPGGGYPPPPTN